MTVFFVLIGLIASVIILIKISNAQAKAKREWRDADFQSEPYKYQIGRHALETLAIRYGIAHREKTIEKYYYYAKGGVKTHNPERDRIKWVDAKTISLRKLKKLSGSEYLVELTDYRNRKAIAVIEAGTEYVKTFLPIDREWFKTNAKLEAVLKGNRSMSIKEMAKAHLDKSI